MYTVRQFLRCPWLPGAKRCKRLNLVFSPSRRRKVEPAHVARTGVGGIGGGYPAAARVQRLVVEPPGGIDPALAAND